MTEGLIDFSRCEQRVSGYDGASTKLKILFEGRTYLLKFGRELPPDPSNHLLASYENSQLSEHIGSRIFELCGIESQKTLLGTFEGRKVVACLDFAENDGNRRLIEFRSLQNSFLGSTSSPRKTPDLTETMEVLERHPYLEGIRESAKRRFWETFAIDSLIGNFDRHAGNWGYILDLSLDRLVECAPVYDCGSSLYPRLCEGEMLSLAQDQEALRRRGEDFPRAALKVGGRKVRYHEFWVSPEAAEARRVLLGLMPNIDLRRIDGLIARVPGVTEAQSRFFRAVIASRYRCILKPGYELALREASLERPQRTRRTVADEASKARERAAELNEGASGGNRQKGRARR